MRIHLLVVGKTNQDFVEKGVSEFVGRLKHYIPFEMEILPDLKNTKNFSSEQLKEKEGELILKFIQSGDYIVLLDEHGKEFTSLKLAEYLEKKTHTVPKRLLFIVGGAYGFSQKVYEAANEKIALSKMTFSHQMIRLIFVEQLYRAMTILNNEPYHHE
jgi:23S rRNA (pseudouridine1915-N3)-methyltransferase